MNNEILNRKDMDSTNNTTRQNPSEVRSSNNFIYVALFITLSVAVLVLVMFFINNKDKGNDLNAFDVREMLKDRVIEPIASHSSDDVSVFELLIAKTLGLSEEDTNFHITESTIRFEIQNGLKYQVELTKANYDQGSFNSEITIKTSGVSEEFGYEVSGEVLVYDNKFYFNIVDFEGIGLPEDLTNLINANSNKWVEVPADRLRDAAALFSPLPFQRDETNTEQQQLLVNAAKEGKLISDDGLFVEMEIEGVTYGCFETNAYLQIIVSQSNQPSSIKYCYGGEDRYYIVFTQASEQATIFMEVLFQENTGNRVNTPENPSQLIIPQL